MREGLLLHNPVVESALQGQLRNVTIRTARRHFLRTTGLTQSTIRQIERARYATLLIKQGASILDTVYEAGYSDQPHLTKSLKYFIGQTPAQIMGKGESVQVSFFVHWMALWKSPAACQLRGGCFHQGEGAVKCAQFKALRIGSFPGMHCARLIKINPPGGVESFVPRCVKV